MRREYIKVEDFLVVFREALLKVEAVYYGMLISPDEALEHARQAGEDTMPRREYLRRIDPRSEDIKAFLDRYDERVFCYELYHQVRICMEEKDRQNPHFTHPFKFQGELRKGVIGKIILDFLESARIGRITGGREPDARACVGLPRAG